MIDSFFNFLTYEYIYYIANIGVIPCWFFLIILPNHIITNFLVKSVIIPLLLSTAYIFISYQIFISENIFEVFNLYLGLDDLYALFSNETYQISKFLVIISLITTYFTGPTGLLIYWLIRIFYSRKINFYD